MVIIEEMPGEVKNKVITAYLQAFYDMLDYDGMKSILNEAGLLELRNIRETVPQDCVKFSILKRIIAAQNCLLLGCNDLLYEIGKKFAFYLFPWGKSFSDIIQEINQLIQTDWNIEILENKDNSIAIKVRNSIFCAGSGDPSELLKGFISYSIQKSLRSNKAVIYKGSEKNIIGRDQNTCILKFKMLTTFGTK